MNRGLIYIIASSFMFALMSALIYEVMVLDPAASPLTASFIRVAVNLLFMILLSCRRGLHQGIKDLFGDGRWSLWARGVFGSLAVMALFYSIHKIGVGEASFLNAFNAVWIAMLSPFVLSQPHSKLGWLAIAVGLIGLYLMFQPELGSSNLTARGIALLSGALGGSAYMMIARAGRSNSSSTVVFYFCFVATIMHILWFLTDGIRWPNDFRCWALLILAGLIASFAQILMTKAYQIGPAAIMSAASYSTPVFNMILSIFVFSIIPNTTTTVGAGLVLLAGVVLPFSQRAQTPHQTAVIPPEITGS